MNEEGVDALVPKRAKHSSYLVEITQKADNIISRESHAKQPYEKLLTDIMEFTFPDGKLYLSAVLDCFDGMVIGWTIGLRPNADLVNTMLDGVIAGWLSSDCVFGLSFPMPQDRTGEKRRLYPLRIQDGCAPNERQARVFCPAKEWNGSSCL